MASLVAVPPTREARRRARQWRRILARLFALETVWVDVPDDADATGVP